MIIKVSKDAYKGVDGSSISQVRCDQIVLVYEMLENMGNNMTSYSEIQNKAQSLALFGNTQARSAIRTFFPLLKKIGFVNYEERFSSNDCFTPLGKQFVLAHKALQNTTDEVPYCKEIKERLVHIKQNLQKIGLIEMNKSTDYVDHNIWVAIRLFNIFRKFHWNEFVYTIHNLNVGKTFNEIVENIKTDVDAIQTIEFHNEKGEELPDTCYVYIRSFLNECNLITNIDKNNSKVTPEFDYFYSQLKI